MKHMTTTRRAPSPVSMVIADSQLEDVMETLRAGIKAVAVGVKGSIPIPDDLVPSLLSAIKDLDGDEREEAAPARMRMASFLGTLFVKHEVNKADETVLQAVAEARPQLKGVGRERGGCYSGQLLSLASSKGSDELRRLAGMLLDGKKLSKEEATSLGRALFDDSEPAPLRSLAAYVLRVRYETLDEWYGLLQAQEETIDRIAFNPLAMEAAGTERKMIVQLAEPFDGVNRSDLVTPLLARHLQKKWNICVVSQVGRSSGPKYGPNLRGLAQTLAKKCGEDRAPFAQSAADVAASAAEGGIVPDFGWYIDQETAAPALGRWINLRRTIIKRPFLATTEKYINPCAASVLIASAFHPSFTDKMFAMAEEATDYRAVIITRRGLEGTLAFGLGKAAQVTCGVRGHDLGPFERYDFAYGPEELGYSTEMDKPLADISEDAIAEKCIKWAESGSSGDTRFDRHVALSIGGYDKAIGWVMARLAKDPSNYTPQSL